MKENMNDRVKIKGWVSRKTADAMRRGEIESNNGLRRSTGRRSWNPEQPEFELDEGPTLDQQIVQAFKMAGAQAIYSIIFEDLYPTARNLFYREIVPAITRKIHELQMERQKTVQVIDVDEEKSFDEETDESGSADNVVDFSQYSKAVNQ